VTPPPVRRPGLRRGRAAEVDSATIDPPETTVTDDTETTTAAPDLPDHEDRQIDETEAAHGEPHVIGEALRHVLDARTPLLRRAFRNVWPLGGDSS
jgi:hypothetical protein